MVAGAVVLDREALAAVLGHQRHATVDGGLLAVDGAGLLEAGHRVADREIRAVLVVEVEAALPFDPQQFEVVVLGLAALARDRLERLRVRVERIGEADVVDHERGPAAEGDAKRLHMSALLGVEVDSRGLVGLAEPRHVLGGYTMLAT
jgi:hypothetical protein